MTGKYCLPEKTTVQFAFSCNIQRQNDVNVNFESRKVKQRKMDV